jgi:site-specific recombinase XerD
VKFTSVADEFLADMRQQGRITSRASERNYRGALYAHAADVENRDPRYVGRMDVKRTLSRWPHPNTQGKNRSILVSFYDWMVEEGLRPHNPARQTKRPRRKPAAVYRLSRDEVIRLLRAANGTRERRAIYLGACAGLRNGELRGRQGRHFSRPGWIWVSTDIAKGSRERYVPVITDLMPIVAEILRNVEPDEYVLPAQRFRGFGHERERFEKKQLPSSSQALRELVIRVGDRAGIAAQLHPHLLRHAYADHIAKHAGVRNAQMLLGHSTLGTTETYLGKPTLDELEAAVRGFTFGALVERAFYPSMERIESPVEAPTGIEPVYTALQAAA